MGLTQRNTIQLKRDAFSMTKMGVNNSTNKAHDNVCHPERVSREVFYSKK